MKIKMWHMMMMTTTATAKKGGPAEAEGGEGGGVCTTKCKKTRRRHRVLYDQREIESGRNNHRALRFLTETGDEYRE